MLVVIDVKSFLTKLTFKKLQTLSHEQSTIREIF